MLEDTLLIITPQLALAAMLFVMGWLESRAAKKPPRNTDDRDD